ncbi:MAG: hypothetical protein WC882_00370 [Candidatus Gracilibacteria bacterium]
MRSTPDSFDHSSSFAAKVAPWMALFMTGCVAPDLPQQPVPATSSIIESIPSQTKIDLSSTPRPPKEIAYGKCADNVAAVVKIFRANHIELCYPDVGEPNPLCLVQPEDIAPCVQPLKS